MKGLTQFLRFDFPAFSEGKSYRVIGCRQWRDYQTRNNLGTCVDCVIVRDETVYPRANASKPTTNLYEKITFKINRSLQIPTNSYVMPVNAQATVYGDYNNMISVKADDVQIIDDDI